MVDGSSVVVVVVAKMVAQLIDLRMLRVATLGEVGSDGFHRSWIMLFPEGKFSHPEYGSLNFTRSFLSEIKAHFDDRVRGIDIMVDQNHDKNQAAGWLEELQIRPALGDTPAGLWAQVRWTPLGAQLLQEQRYRYFSPEFGPDKNNRTGKVTNNVLLGGGLTNRPFLKEMDAVTLSELAEVSTKSWASVNKSELPRSCFLVQGSPDDKSTWKLPVYEGAGTKDADGHYTQRGPLNINAVRAALAAIGGARSGTPMNVPGSVKSRLQNMLARYGGGKSDSGGGSGGSASENVIPEAKGGVKKMARAKLADGQDQSDVDDGSSYAEFDDGSDGGDGVGFDPNSDTHAAMTTDGHVHGKFAEHPHDGNADHSDAPLKGGKSMAEPPASRQHSHYSEAKTLAEANRKMAEQQHELAEMKFNFYRLDMEKRLDSWFRGEMTFSETSSKTRKPEGGKPAQRRGTWSLSPKAQDAVRAYFLSERGFTLAEDDRSDLCDLIETVARGVVDLSVRGGSRDTEAGKTLTSGRPRNQHPDDALQEAVEEYLSEKGMELSELQADLRSTDVVRSVKAGKLIEQAQQAAARKIDYEGIVH